MFKMKSTLVVLFCVIGNSILANRLISEPDGPIPSELHLVATVDGKSFFADRSVMRTWFEAKDYCTSVGLKLAEITSKAQDDALKAGYGPGFDDRHWTAGRDAQEPRQFTWDESGVAISNDNPELRSFQGLGYQTCLFYWSQPDNESALYYRKCNDITGVLCST